jgi:hypothetical protein
MKFYRHNTIIKNIFCIVKDQYVSAVFYNKFLFANNMYFKI